MQIVIDIPEETYNEVCWRGLRLCPRDDKELVNAIKNGTPLPKGHGDLVDYEELKNNAGECGAYTEATLSHIKPKIIIKADTESEEV